jgi:hypothetical protein
MHDIDRTLMEIDPEAEYEPEFESDYEYGEFEAPDTETVFDEAEEMEMAAELLGVSDEAELDQFWGGLLKKAGGAIGKFVKTPTGQALKGILKKAAKKYLPTVAGALGTAIGGPAGAALGSQLASQAGRIFGLELEGLSPEDQELEMAKGMVRFGAEAAKNAALTPPSSNPQADAKAAAVEAAKQYAPGLLKPATSPPSYSPMMTSGSGRSGRWVRRGRKIILYGT